MVHVLVHVDLCSGTGRAGGSVSSRSGKACIGHSGIAKGGRCCGSALAGTGNQGRYLGKKDFSQLVFSIQIWQPVWIHNIQHWGMFSSWLECQSLSHPRDKYLWLH